MLLYYLNKRDCDKKQFKKFIETNDNICGKNKNL